MDIPVKDLRKVLELVRPLIPKNTSLPATRYLLIKGGRAMATDMEVSVTIQMDHSSPEPIMLPVLHVLELLKRVPGASIATLTPTKTGLVIKAAGTAATLKHEAAGDFPVLLSQSLEHELVMDGGALVEALVEEAQYAAKEDSRPMLRAVCLHLDNPVEVVAADGFRLSIRTLPGDLSQHSRNLIVPLAAIRALAHLWKTAASTPDFTVAASLAEAVVAKRLLRIQYNDDMARLTFGRITLTSQLVQGSFPNYRDLVPKAESSTVSFMGQDFHRALSLIGGIARDGSAVARMEWGGMTMKLSAHAGDVGEVATELPLLSCSGTGKIAVNCTYLLAYARAVSGVVTMKTTTPSSPLLLLSEGQPQVVLMPMFVQWDGQIAHREAAESSEGQEEKQIESAPSTDYAEGEPAAVKPVVCHEEGANQHEKMTKTGKRRATKAA